MSGHTPGPWYVCGESRMLVCWEGGKRGNKTVAITDGAGTIDVLGLHAQTNDKAIGEANARLIAAAPELLEAARNLELWYRGGRLQTYLARCADEASYGGNRESRGQGVNDKTVNRICAFLQSDTIKHRLLPWAVILVGFGFIFNLGMIIVQGDLVPFSTGNANPGQEDGAFVLWVKSTGETVYTDLPEGALEGAAEITPALARELLSTTYPDPATATEAASPDGPDLSGNPAFAHAVQVCTHSSGKVSNQTGGGRHLTRFDGHWNSDHHTTTFHQVLTQNGYQTYDTFKYTVSRKYCGC